MKLLLTLFAAALVVPMTSCATNDPDLNPQAQKPESESRRVPWNTPVSGQGGGALGNLPQQQRR